MDSLSVSDHLFITAIAENGEGLARYQAQELLCFFYNECAEYQIDMSGGQNKAFIKEDNQERDENGVGFEVYPNPAYAQVTIKLPQIDAPLLITIVDINGKLVYTKKVVSDKVISEIWDAQNRDNGNYLISVRNLSTNEIIGTQKVTIQH
jgi:hypothetical protein